MDDQVPVGEPDDQGVTGGSTHAESDRAARERDAAAVARDRAAALRDEASAAQAARDRRLTAEDRVAAAVDREAAALALRAVAKQLESAYRDDLTQLLSRVAGRDQLGHAIDRARRVGDPLVVVFVDVDHLKQINDAHGHAYGDRVLQALGAALGEGLRSYDVVMRYGGDEFVCALVGSLLAPAETRLSEIGRVLSEASAGASISVGFAELREGEGLDDVIHRADRDMYERRTVSRTTDL